MSKIKYLAMVTYVYTAPNGQQMFDSENMNLDFLPNTEKGLKRIREKLEDLYPSIREVRILSLIPLNKDTKEVESEIDEDDD